MLSDELGLTDAAARSYLLRETLETQRLLLELAIRRFDDVASMIPLRASEPDWHGLARRTFDRAIADLAGQLDRVRQSMDLAQWQTVQGIDNLSGRVR